LEGIKFSNKLIKYILNKYPKFGISRWIYSENYVAIENTAGGVGLSHIDRYVKMIWRDPDNILHKINELDPYDLIFLFQHINPVYKFIGHAYINSIVNNKKLINLDSGDPLKALENSNYHKIVFIGYFPPLIKRFNELGFDIYVSEATLDIVPKDIREKLNIFPWWSIEDLLIDADALIITGSAIPNNTIGRILTLAREIKFKAILGPSTTLCKDVFKEYGVTYLGGSIVIDNNKLFELLKEGVGYHILEDEGVIKKVSIKL